MTFELSERRYGAPRPASELAITEACKEVFIAFCDLMDAGDVDQAVDLLHADDLIFYDVGKPEPSIGKEPFRTRMKTVRFSYPGRRTLHTPTNFRFHRVTESEAECRVIIALFDLLKNPEGRGISRYSSEFLGYAREEVRFTPDKDGVWKFQTRKSAFIAGAKRLPIGTLPGHLPWNETDERK
jgi:hypothetical protein